MNGRRGLGLNQSVACLFVLAGIFVSGCSQQTSPLSPANTGQSTGGIGGLFVSLNPGGTIFVDVGTTRRITATLVSDPTGKGVTWTLSGTGTLSGATTNSVLYTAPSTQTPPDTIKATSVGDPTQAATASLVIVSLPTISTTSLPNGTVGAAYNSTINVSNGSIPFNWSLASGSIPPGLGFSVSSSAGISVVGTPTVAGTYNFKMQVADVSNSVASQTYTVVIAAAGPSPSTQSQLAGNGVNNAMLDGSYAFGFNGSGPNGLVAAAGSFTADGKGNITGGVEDRNSGAGVATGIGFTGTYAIGANQLGVMTLNRGDSTSATFALAVTSEGNARFIEIDNVTGKGTLGSGEAKKRDVSALAAGKIAGSYAFELTGVDAGSARLAMVGEFAVSDAGAVTQGLFDANDAGRMTNLAPISGTYNVSSAGSGGATLTLSGFGNVHLNLYAVSPDEAFAVETDTRSSGEPLFAGTILRQSGGPFTSTSLSGSAVLQMMGSGDKGLAGTVGVIQFNGIGDAHLLALQASTANLSNVDDTSFLSPGVEGRASFGSTGQFITYLVSPTRAFVLGTDSGALAGSFEQREPGAFDLASIRGTLVGTTPMSFMPVSFSSATSLSVDGKQGGTISTVAIGLSGGPQFALTPFPLAFSISDGVVQLNRTDGAPDALVGVLFVVSPNKAIYAPLGAEVLYIQILER